MPMVQSGLPSTRPVASDQVVDTAAGDRNAREIVPHNRLDRPDASESAGEP